MSSDRDVLIVGCDEDFAAAIRYQCHRFQAVVHTISDFEEALAALEKETPALLLLEWNLRDLSAIDFLVRVSEQLCWGEMRVFFASDHELTESEEFQMATLGAEKCFLKHNLLGTDALRDFIQSLEEIFTREQE